MHVHVYVVLGVFNNISTRFQLPCGANFLFVEKIRVPWENHKHTDKFYHIDLNWVFYWQHISYVWCSVFIRWLAFPWVPFVFYFSATCSQDKRKEDITWTFNLAFRYTDDVLSLNSLLSTMYVDSIYHTELDIQILHT